MYEIIDDGKNCCSCGEIKSLRDFGDKLDNFDGLTSWCNECRDNSADQALKEKYGIDLFDYEDMLEEQDFKCAICKSEDSRNPTKIDGRFAVDHCHKTGKVRGLLCAICNRGLGYFKDDISALSEAIKYLVKKR